MKTFDELLNSILMDYQNQFPGIDISKGSLVFIKSACIASALWGLFQQLDWTGRQIFSDTSDSDMLERHCFTYGISRISKDEDDASLLARLLNRLRHAPAGGNKNDYEQWALSVWVPIPDGKEYVKQAYCFPCPFGAGSVGVSIISSSTDETASPALIDAVIDYLNLKRPVAMVGFDKNTIVDPARLTPDITVALKAISDLKTITPVITAALTQYIKGLKPSETLFTARLLQTVMEIDDVSNAKIISPVSDVTCAWNQIIRPGTITVTNMV
jgi:uncharacterized phage protein gp47/JayE